jgi:hypothetical protein
MTWFALIIIGLLFAILFAIRGNSNVGKLGVFLVFAVCGLPLWIIGAFMLFGFVWVPLAGWVSP